jgi:dolichol-phosphate mannosyltransferase
VGYNLLSVVIPVYNEEKTVGALLENVLKVKLPINLEIIVVDDGSKDNSASIIQKVIASHKTEQIKYYRKTNGGKGSAVRMGLEKAKGDIFVIQDADLEYDPNDYNTLLRPILAGKSKVVYGSRYLSDMSHLKENQHLTFRIHKFGNQCLSLLTSILYLQKLTDMETCYKMFTRDVYSRIRLVSNNFNIEPEITSKIIKRGYRIREVPISYYSRDWGGGKKITWKDGIRALLSLIKWRFRN